MGKDLVVSDYLSLDSVSADSQWSASYEGGHDVSVALGGFATKDVLEGLAMRKRLRQLITRFKRDGLVSGDSAKAASYFVEALPGATVLPKIAPDEDQSLLMVWRRDGKSTMLTFDGWVLNCVDDVEGVVTYYDDLPLEEGQDLPPEILGLVAPD